jgi:AraC family transcriptional regulator, regulatory protein of adaptative response / methylated-DNA-[protein]-cysteine methyltransferase
MATSTEGMISAQAQLVSRARAYLDAHAEESVTLADLARAVGGSAHHLQRIFTRAVGVSPKQYAAALRVRRLKTELRRRGTVSEAVFDAGYNASSRAYDAARTHLGMTPAAYRRGGDGVAMRYVTVGTSLGRLLIAATARGVCAVTLGDRDGALEEALSDEYPNADCSRVTYARLDRSDDFRTWIDVIVAHVEGHLPHLLVPTDVPATDFQQRVWDTLRAIPYGETRTYAEVAAAVGSPHGARAVGSACAHNPVALLVPCHRVVRRGGALGGYRWGLDRKQRLLESERRNQEGQSR